MIYLGKKTWIHTDSDINAVVISDVSISPDYRDTIDFVAEIGPALLMSEEVQPTLKMAVEAGSILEFNSDVQPTLEFKTETT